MSEARFSWIVIRVAPPRTDTTISKSRCDAPRRVATQENERPNWLTCPTFVSMRRISSTIIGHSVSGSSPSTTRSNRSVVGPRSEEHTSELQSRLHLVCRLLLEKKKKISQPLLQAKPPIY